MIKKWYEPLYGWLPQQEAPIEHTPWQVINIDMVGPWRITDNKHTLYALTIIDPAMGWFESIEIPDKSMYSE